MEQKNKIKQMSQWREGSNKQINGKQYTSVLADFNSSYFQVSINSNKLNHLFEKIQHKLYLQNKKIQELANDYQVMGKRINDKIEKQSKKYYEYYQQLDKKIALKIAEKDTQNCVIMSIVKQNQIKDEEIHDQIYKLGQKVDQIQLLLQQQLKNGLLRIKQQIIGPISLPEPQNPKQQNRKQNKKQQSSQKQLPVVSSQAKNKKNIDFNYLIRYFNQQLSKTKKQICSNMQLFYNVHKIDQNRNNSKQEQHLMHKKQNIQDEWKNLDQFDGMTDKILYPSKSNNSNQNYKTQSYVFSPMQKNQYPNSYNENANKNANKMKNFSQIHSHYQEKLSEMIQKVNKISYLQQMVNNQSTSISQIRNKQIVIDEKTILLTKKLQKLNTQQIQLKNYLRRLQAFKMDQRSIEQLKNNIKFALKEMQDKIADKCSEQDFMKQKTRISQKISILHENLTQKANKEQVLKALVFLQNKIKQIVFLIASEQSEIREGAVTKITPKCLSCDKELQKQVQAQVLAKNQNVNKNNVLLVKTMTHRVRQKIKRQLNKVKTLGNFTSQEIQNDFKSQA